MQQVGAKYCNSAKFTVMWIATSFKSCVVSKVDVKFGPLYSYLVISHRSLLRSKCNHGIIRISDSICNRHIEDSVYILEEKRFHYRGTTEPCCNTQIGKMFSFEVYMYSKYNENFNWRFDGSFSSTLLGALVMYWQRWMRRDKKIMNFFFFAMEVGRSSYNLLSDTVCDIFPYELRKAMENRIADLAPNIRIPDVLYCI